MNIAVCDDSIDAIDNLVSAIQIHKLSNSYNIEVFNLPCKFLNSIQKSCNYDLVFLDVDMPQINGIELGKTIRSYLPESIIVYVTNYPQYAIDAFDCDAYKYLLKPINVDKLHNILDKICNKYKSKHAEYIIQGRFENVRVPIKDILFVEYVNKHLNFYIDGTTYEHYEIKGSLYDVQDKLEMWVFFRCHEAFIVNLAKIKRFIGYNIVLVNGEEIPVSVRKKSRLIFEYTRYFEEIL